jgi:hypothetical protein
MNMINPETIKAAVALAKSACDSADAHKSETYLAVLLAALLSPSEAPAIARPGQAYPPTSVSRPTTAKPYSAAELFSSRSWSTEIDKVMLAGYFLETYSAATSYTVAELRELLLSAKVPPPNNLNLAVLKAVQKGAMMEVDAKTGEGGRKTWALTQTGLKHIEDMAESKST